MNIEALVQEDFFTRLPILGISVIVAVSMAPLPAGSAEEAYAIPILSFSEAMERLKFKRESQKGMQQVLAMYSSIFGGIVTDPAAMLIPMDDHMVHLGHGIFDSTTIVDGYLYKFDQHLDRFLRSASMAKIGIPFDRETIRTVLLETASASKCKNGSIRYWLSAGSGNFQFSPSGCEPAFYAIVLKDHSISEQKGVKVITSTIPIKPPPFSTIKSVNYLPNVLSKMEAEECGALAAIWLDKDGFVAEGPHMNVGFVTKEKEFLLPRFDNILNGCTIQRVLDLAEGLVKEGKLKRIRIDNVSPEEAKRADEMMLISSSLLIRSVVQWDEQVIGNGKEGPIATALFNLLLKDMKEGPPTIRVSIPF